MADTAIHTEKDVRRMFDGNEWWLTYEDPTGRHWEYKVQAEQNGCIKDRTGYGYTLRDLQHRRFTFVWRDMYPLLEFADGSMMMYTHREDDDSFIRLTRLDGVVVSVPVGSIKWIETR
ncbi:hypothetical protein [Bifidobacterium sp. SO1]|uniref:hypothetical protein n=1 Tax=Bifidobacterium sp. SO1 TaxID=2809029 RepID=UPI001BDD5BB3|nr:hypothetical protein [Bifidobacterium sp. SO1]MBT1161698.1 hypothetical protein [Bifidobacterium sp. SO1]